MAKWINFHRNNSFVNQMQLPLLCEKSGAIATLNDSGSYSRQVQWHAQSYEFENF